MSRQVAKLHAKTLMFLHLPTLDLHVWVEALERHNWRYIRKPITFVGPKTTGHSNSFLNAPLMNSGWPHTCTHIYTRPQVFLCLCI